MPVIDILDINQWLGTNKLEVASLTGTIAELEDTQRAYVFGRLFSTYEDAIVGWTTVGNTPTVVKAVVAMRVAGHIYIRQYAEEASTWASYGQYLLRESEDWIKKLLSGALDIDGLDYPVLGTPAFYPDDAATEVVQLMGEDGDLIRAAEAPRYASMNERF